jgi:flagellar basal body rod protein FlgG
LATSLPVPDTVVDYRAGSVRYTGGSLDVALDGDGFFELQSEQGPVYTRNGNFQIDASGRIVHPSGLPLAGDLTLTTMQPRIDAQGNVYENDRLVGQLRIATFDPRTPMAKQGEGLFVAPDAAVSRITGSKVRQGFLENSNVVTVTEMVNVIETMRHFEANQKLIQGYDGMMDRAIRTLGEF